MILVRGGRQAGRGLLLCTALVAALLASGLPVDPAHATARRVHWRGPVEHLFFHPLVADPARTFHGPQGQGFKDYFVTADEFGRIVRELYRRHWALVDIHAAVGRRLRVPQGRKPLVLSIDDLNYYDYMRATGPAWRLVLDRSGRVAVELRDRSGRRRRSRTAEIVPVLDDFVTAHPDFSIDGARGVIAETGYEGVLGERTNERSARDWAKRVARARRLVRRLKETGWTFASHSWGHIDLSRRSAAAITADATRWRREVRPLVGSTDVYVYPFGARPTRASRELLRSRFGFRIFCSIDAVAGTIRGDRVIEMYRRHVDGIAFADQRRNLAPFFSVAAVIDAVNRR